MTVCLQRMTHSFSSLWLYHMMNDNLKKKKHVPVPLLSWNKLSLDDSPNPIEKTMYNADSSSFLTCFVIITDTVLCTNIKSYGKVMHGCVLIAQLQQSVKDPVKSGKWPLLDVWVTALSQHSEWDVYIWTLYQTLNWGPCSDKYPTEMSNSSFSKKTRPQLVAKATWFHHFLQPLEDFCYFSPSHQQ